MPESMSDAAFCESCVHFHPDGRCGKPVIERIVTASGESAFVVPCRCKTRPRYWELKRREERAEQLARNRRDDPYCAECSHCGHWHANGYCHDCRLQFKECRRRPRQTLDARLHREALEAMEPTHPCPVDPEIRVIEHRCLGWMDGLVYDGDEPVLCETDLMDEHAYAEAQGLVPVEPRPWRRKIRVVNWPRRHA